MRNHQEYISSKRSDEISINNLTHDNQLKKFWLQDSWFEMLKNDNEISNKNQASENFFKSNSDSNADSNSDHESDNETVKNEIIVNE